MQMQTGKNEGDVVTDGEYRHLLRELDAKGGGRAAAILKLLRPCTPSLLRPITVRKKKKRREKKKTFFL